MSPSGRLIDTIYFDENHSSNPWKYENKASRTPGAFRAFEVDGLLKTPPKIRIFEWADLRYSNQREVRNRRLYPKYAAISHVWDMSKDVRKILSGSDNLSIKTDQYATPVLKLGWDGLQTAAWAARLVRCDYIWLDLICLDQVGKFEPWPKRSDSDIAFGTAEKKRLFGGLGGDPRDLFKGDQRGLSDGDKSMTIQNMTHIYKYAVEVIIMVGGAGAVQGVEGPSNYMDRAWPLKESTSGSRETSVLVTWPFKKSFTIYGDKGEGDLTVTFKSVQGNNCLVPLQSLLKMSELAIDKVKKSIGLPDKSNFKIRCLDGDSKAKPVVAMAAKNALIHYFTYFNKKGKQALEGRRAAIWRGMMLRTSSNAKDVIYCVQSMMGLEIDPSRNDRGIQFLFNDLARKMAARGSPGWLTIGKVKGSTIPRYDNGHSLFPKVPVYGTEKTPFYEINHKKVPTGFLVDGSNCYITSYHIKFMSISLPHLICAQLLFVNKPSKYRKVDKRKSFRMYDKKNTGLCVFAGKSTKIALVIGTIGSWPKSKKSTSSTYKGWTSIIFLSRKGGEWVVSGDGAYNVPYSKLSHKRYHLTIGRGTRQNKQYWACDHGSKPKKKRLRYSYGILPISSLVHDTLGPEIFWICRKVCPFNISSVRTLTEVGHRGNRSRQIAIGSRPSWSHLTPLTTRGMRSATSSTHAPSFRSSHTILAILRSTSSNLIGRPDSAPPNSNSTT